MLRLVAPALLLFALNGTGCCQPPQDPKKPEETTAAAQSRALLQELQRGDYDSAWDRMHEVSYKKKVTKEAFIMGARRIQALKEFSDIKVDRVHYSRAGERWPYTCFNLVKMRLDGTVQTPKRRVPLRLEAYMMGRQWHFNVIAVDNIWVR